MINNQSKNKAHVSLIKKTGVILISLYVLYVIAGLWVVAPLVKPRLENKLSAQIGRKVTIEEIEFNPFVLSATATNLNIHQKDGKPFAGFKELFVNVQISSIAKWAATFKEIRVLAPFAELKLLPDNRSNIDDIMAKFSQPESTPDQKSELPAVVISSFQVRDGKFIFDDSTGAETIQETFSPVSFTLENLSTLKERHGAYKFAGAGPSGGQYHLDGQVSVNPIGIEGSYSVRGIDLKHFWSHIEERVSSRIHQGKIDTSGNFSFKFVDGEFNAILSNGNFKINDFQLTEKGSDTVFIDLPSFSLQGISADLKSRQVVVGTIRSADAKFVSWLAPDGTFKLQSLLLNDLQELVATKKEGSAEPEALSSRPWQVSMNNLVFSDWAFMLEDRTLPESARFSFDKIGVTVDHLSNNKDAKAKVAIELHINQSGKVNVNGFVGIDPLEADLKVVSERIALKSFQAYADTAVKAKIVKGSVSSEGRILYQGKSDQPQIHYQGQLNLDDLELEDRLQEKDFVKLAQIKTTGMVLDLNPNKLHVAEILIDQLFARIGIDANGNVNVVQVFSPIEKEGRPGQDNLLKRLVNFLTMQIEGPIPIAVDRVQLNHFSSDFIDESITPSYATQLVITKGSVKGLSSEPTAQADFKIEGTLDESATIRASGKMNPMHAFRSTQVDFGLSDFDLKPMSPYSGKYVGYKIDQGKLQLKLKYLVDKHRIDAKNIIEIDQLTLGETVDSRDAIDLPVALGVALLKDSNGRIMLEVPVGGDVKDPQFDIGKTITSALTKTVDDLAKSPFSAIEEIDGIKGEELRHIEFGSGLSELNSEATKKLNALARFINERKELIVSVEGSADRRKDVTHTSGKEHAKETVDEKFRAEKVQEKDSPTETVIDDHQLEQLAQMRAKQVQTYLIQQEKVASKRVQLKPVRINESSNQDNWGVELFLSVE